MKFSRQKTVMWALAGATGLGLAYSLAVRYTSFMVAPRSQKIITLGALIPLGLIFSFWLFQAVIAPLIRGLPVKRFLTLGAISVVLTGAIFAIFCSKPPFPERHEFSLTVLGEKQPESGAGQVEVISISTVAIPGGNLKKIPAADLALEGTWRGTNSGYGIIGEPGYSLQYERYMQAGLDLRFAIGPSGGMVHIIWDGQEQVVNSYAAAAGEKTVTLNPGWVLHRAHRTHQALAVGALLAEGWVAVLISFSIITAFWQATHKRNLRLRNPLLLGGILLAFILLECAAMAINQPVVFENRPLELVIREALQRPEGEVYSRHLRTMTVLDASNSRITNLADINLLPNLEDLNLRGNAIRDIAPLAELKSLKTLNLRGNQVRNLSPLASLTSLEYLNLYGNTSIADIHALLGLENLRTLILAFVPVGEQVEGLSRLPNLERLNLRQTGVADISELVALENLEYLNLYGNTDILSSTPIGQLRNLETLILANVPVGESPEFLKDLTRLRYLNLRASGVANLRALTGLRRLRYLNLHSNPHISSLQPLSGLSQLETLVLANVPIGKDADVLLNFPCLHTLNLRNTGLSDLTPIGALLAQGALQDKPRKNIMASLDIRENPIRAAPGDEYAALRPYWAVISDRQPFRLPFFAALQPPIFSHSAGFYEDNFLLSMEPGGLGREIHFTLDGSLPTIDSPLYTKPLDIMYRSDAPNQISAIQSIAANYRAPLNPVAKAAVVRAAVFSPQTGAQSPIVTQTYFVGAGKAEQYSIPVISLVSPAEGLFDAQSGIYVLGDRYESMADADVTEDERQAYANFNQRGRAWEREVSIEIFEPEGGYFRQDGGIRMHGAGSRRNPQKSLRLYARPEYDEEPIFSYDIFAEIEMRRAGADSPEYQAFVLRNGGQDWSSSILRDAFLQSLAEGVGLDTQAGRFAVVFLNGEYWGLYNLQERYDAAYLSNHYGISAEQAIILRMNGEMVVGQSGDEQSYFDMLKFMHENDLAEQANYERLDTMMDISAYMDYLIFNIYAANQDWPDKNIYLWRMKPDNDQLLGQAGRDGRWRWMINDLDISFGLKNREGDIIHDTLTHAQLPGWSGFIFRELLKNDQFRADFDRRFEELLATTLAPENVAALLDQKGAEIYPYLEEFFARWGLGPLEDWENEFALMHEFARERSGALRRLLNLRPAGE